MVGCGSGGGGGSLSLAPVLKSEGTPRHRHRVNTATAVVCYSRKTFNWSWTWQENECGRCSICLRIGKPASLPFGSLGSGRRPKTNRTECSGKKPCARAARWVKKKTLNAWFIIKRHKNKSKKYLQSKYLWRRKRSVRKCTHWNIYFGMHWNKIGVLIK